MCNLRLRLLFRSFLAAAFGREDDKLAIGKAKFLNQSAGDRQIFLALRGKHPHLHAFNLAISCISLFYDFSLAL